MSERVNQLGGTLKVESNAASRHDLASGAAAGRRIRKSGRIKRMKKLRILLADDHAVMRTGLRAL